MFKVLTAVAVVSLAAAGLVATAAPASAAATPPCRTGANVNYAGGTGTAGDPFTVADATQLGHLRATSTDWSCHFVLAQDIPMGGAVWSAGIGTSVYAFAGTFDGAGFEISDLTISSSVESRMGLFGYVSGNGSSGSPATTGIVSNVTFSGTVTGTVSGGYVGGLVGWLQKGSLSASSFDGTVTGSNSAGAKTGGLVGWLYAYATVAESQASGTVSTGGEIGGLVGRATSSVSVTRSHADVTVSGGMSYAGGLIGNNGGAITQSYATGSVTGGANVGGLVGNNDGNGAVTGSYATGSVSGASTTAGGLVGTGAGRIATSYATGTVTGGVNAGGLTGQNTATATITDSYATGTVTGGTIMGGLAGFQATGAASVDSFWNAEANPTLLGIGTIQSGPGSNTGATPSSVAQLRTLTTFTGAGWSIAGQWSAGSTWGICDGTGYPYLTAFYTSGTAPTCAGGDTGVVTTPVPPARYTFTFNTSTGGECFTWTVTRGPVALPGSTVACVPEGSELIGWAVPGQAAHFSDGGVVTASADQTFTAVSKNPRIAITYDANVGDDTACLVDGVDTNQRWDTVDVTRDGVLAKAPPCTPTGVSFAGWTDRPTTDGPSVAVTGALTRASGDAVPSRWSVDPDAVNAVHLYAMWTAD